MVSYVKSVMQYMQLTVDFGFMLSATTAIVAASGDRKSIGSIVSHTILAKLLLCAAALAVLAGMTVAIDLLRQNVMYVFLSFVTVALSAFLVDYLFRGLEQMQEITIRFVTMKGIATALTFLFVRSDADLLWIPVLDILGTLVSLVLVWVRVRKYELEFCVPGLLTAWKQLKDSARYFVSETATTAFGALNTLLIGIMLPAAQIALWSVAMQIISAVQVMFSPITNGIYPEMVRNRSLKLLKKVMGIFVPVLIAGCAALYFLSGLAIVIVSGEKYLDAVPVLRCLIPVLLLSFPAMLFGWPALGAIGRVKETTITTVVSAVFQCAGLGLLMVSGAFTIVNIALLRCATEFVLLSGRLYFCIRCRKEFHP
jgi:PST family polysaccharide transporter